MYKIYVILDHKTDHKGQFRFIRHMKAEYKSFPLIYGLLFLDNIWLRYNDLKTWNLTVHKNLNIEKIAFKVVQMKSLAMHVTNQK